MFKPLILASAISLLSSSLLCSTAFATPLQSQTGWITSGFGEGGPLNQQFCATAKGYSQNTVLTFAQNPVGERSLALESDSLALEPGRSYAVVLQSGRDYLSSFDIKPVSARALVLKLGRDEAFFDALDKNKELKLKLGPTQMDIALNDFTQGYAELEQCLSKFAALRSSAPPAPVQNTVQAQKPPEKQVVKQIERPAEKGSIPAFAEYEQPKSRTQIQAQPKAAPQPLVRPEAPKKMETLPKPVPNAAQELEQQYLDLDRRRSSAREDRLSGNLITPPDQVRSGSVPLIEATEVARIDAERPSSFMLDEVAQMRAENSRLARALEAERRRFENQAVQGMDSNIVQDLTQQVDVLAKENRILKSKIDADESGRGFIDMAGELAKMQVREKNLLVQIAEQRELAEQAEAFQAKEERLRDALEIEQEKARLAELRLKEVMGQAGATDKSQVTPLLQEVERLKAREQQLMAALAENRSGMPDRADPRQYPGASRAGEIDRKVLTEMEGLRAENERLRSALLSVQNAGQMEGAGTDRLNEISAQASKAYLETIEKLNAQLASLSQENQGLRQRLSEMPVSKMAFSDQADQRADFRIEKMQKRYEQSEQENRRLGGLLASARQEIASLAGGDINKEVRAVSQKNVSQPIKAARLSADQAPAPAQAARADQARPQTLRPQGNKAQQILASAQMPLTSSVSRLDRVSQSGFEVYQWTSGNVYGTAEITKAMGDQVLDTLHAAYIEKTRKRCNGAFEAVLADGLANGAQMLAYDVACIDGPNSEAVASLYFLYDGEDFITFAFETTADNFAEAMALRDQLMHKS